MGRPSKLTPDEWAAVERRILAGEPGRRVGADFGISETAIRQKLGAIKTVHAQSLQVRSIAHKLAEAGAELAALPPGPRAAAIDMAERLRGISSNLTGAAEHGSATSHRLAEIASAQVAKINAEDPMESQDILQAISALTKMSNDAGSMGVNLIAATSRSRQEAAPGLTPMRGLGAMTADQLRERVRRLGIV